jgi:hypothetical protein
LQKAILDKWNVCTTGAILTVPKGLLFGARSEVGEIVLRTQQIRCGEKVLNDFWLDPNVSQTT